MPSKPKACAHNTTHGQGLSQLEDKVIREAITPARLTAFDTAAAAAQVGDSEALRLYEWNAELSSALLLPLHLFEVVLRNTIHEALTLTYQERWPWDGRFINSVPRRHGPGRNVYDPRSDIQRNAHNHSTTGKVIPEMKFVFWEHMLTSRYDRAIWDSMLPLVFPAIPCPSGTSTAVRHLATDVGTVRKIRNRVAHHEPIFSRNVLQVIDAIERVASYRDSDVGQWVTQLHRVRTVLAQKPSWFI